MRNKKIKVLAHLLAYSMACAGCQADIDAFIKQAKPLLPDDDSFESKNKIVQEYAPTNIGSMILDWISCDNEPRQEMVVITKDTPLYVGTTESSLSIGFLCKGSKAEKILSCDNGWDLLDFGGQLGYVPRRCLRITGNIVDVDYEHKECKDIVLTTDSLNFRVSPDKNSELISTFSEGSELEVVAKVDNGWYLVKHNGVLGYVLDDYTISLLEQAQNCYPELNLEELDVKKIVYAKSKLNFRVGNSKESECIGQLQKYETVRVLGEYNGWYFVMTNNRTFGFVNAEYTADLNDKFVIVDIGEQRLYLYNDDELHYTTPVTTGKDSSPSDKGMFSIFEKERDTYLMNDSFVNYWMQYTDTGEGLHDASWRRTFGTSKYKTNGSHGCVNIPPEITDEIYNDVEIGTRVLVHR
ncbi:MAG: hypothetical protein E7167_06180 [Firmicutes bacterium]|nr:hypothetical protein [Bacillota bacterium]